MAFPDIHKFPVAHPGPYERQMGSSIVGLLRLFRGRVPDAESNARVSELAGLSDRWLAGHCMFDEIRSRLLAAENANDRIRSAQYCFEESCLQAMYNATDASDPFDPGSAFFVAGNALALAKVVGVSVETVAAVLTQAQ